MKRPLAPVVLVLVAIAVGCGPTKAKAYSALDVERAFFRAGVPLQYNGYGPVPAVAKKDPYLRPPPGAVSYVVPVEPRMRHMHLKTVLGEQLLPGTASAVVYVFESEQDAHAALRPLPLVPWSPPRAPIVAQKRNILIVAQPKGNTAFAAGVRRALANLR
jgi:hypothetical protein